MIRFRIACLSLVTCASTWAAPPTPTPILPEGTGTLMATFSTTAGEIRCTLFEKEVPKTVTHFVGLATGKKPWIETGTRKAVRRPFYQDLSFHRIVSGTLIQAGCPIGDGTGGPGYTIEDEFSPVARHGQAGTLGLANRGPHTGGSQFYITTKPLPHYDFHYAVIGQCQDLAVINAIARTPTKLLDIPTQSVRIKSVHIWRQDSKKK